MIKIPLPTMNSRAAKIKLKKHLDRNKADENFVITEGLALYWWRIINRAAFGGKMKTPIRFDIKPDRTMRDCWGECKGYDAGEVKISVNETIVNRELLIATITHEMIHQWQWENFNKMNHTDSHYRRLSRKFKKEFGIGI